MHKEDAKKQQIANPTPEEDSSGPPDIPLPNFLHGHISEHTRKQALPPPWTTHKEGRGQLKRANWFE